MKNGHQTDRIGAPAGASKQEGVSRRQFLKIIGGVAAGGATLGTIANLPATGLGTGSPNAKAKQARKKTRQWVMVVDLRKCEGCTTIDQAPQCTQACIQVHYVPDGQQWIQVYPRELPGEGSYFMPTPCYQCENAPCVNVCPVAATYHTEEGLVLIDHERCIGCRLCMAACPYQRRFFNWSDPQLPPEARFASYSPEYPVPARRGTVIKCMFCAHRLDNGQLPACVEGCPMKALYMGDMAEDVASNGVEVVQLSTFLAENNAYRHKEELGTQPRVYYIPGHGQRFNRRAKDRKDLKPVKWEYGTPGHQPSPKTQ